MGKKGVRQISCGRMKKHFDSLVGAWRRTHADGWPIGKQQSNVSSVLHIKKTYTYNQHTGYFFH